jgi:hypothetical protein
VAGEQENVTVSTPIATAVKRIATANHTNVTA